MRTESNVHEWRVHALSVEDLRLDESLRLAIAGARTRKNLYALIPNLPDAGHRELLLALFDEEMKFRDALWHGHAEDDGDFFENIYECAFLLYKLGDPHDVFLLWRAKYLNMDVGSSLGAEYFVGAGVQSTLEFLESNNHDESKAMHSYLAAFFAESNALAEQVAWENERLRYFERDPA
jgi:hypothetical protein